MQFCYLCLCVAHGMLRQSLMWFLETIGELWVNLRARSFVSCQRLGLFYRMDTANETTTLEMTAKCTNIYGHMHENAPTNTWQYPELIF